MFCKNCGTALDDDALFCEKCGTAMRQAAPVEVPVEEIPTEPAVATAVLAPVEEAQKKSRKLPVKWLALGAALLVALIAAALLLGGSGGAATDEIYHHLNYINSGDFAYDGERLYFISKYYDSDDEPSLYSTDYRPCPIKKGGCVVEGF